MQSELNFKQLFANSIDEVYLVDANNLKIIDANNAVIRKLGYSKEELCKLTVSDIKANHIVPNPILSRLDAVKNGEEVDYETVHQTKEGFIYPVRLKVKKYVITAKMYSWVWDKIFLVKKLLRMIVLNNLK